VVHASPSMWPWARSFTIVGRTGDLLNPRSGHAARRPGSVRAGGLRRRPSHRTGLVGHTSGSLGQYLTGRKAPLHPDWTGIAGLRFRSALGVASGFRPTRPRGTGHRRRLESVRGDRGFRSRFSFLTLRDRAPSPPRWAPELLLSKDGASCGTPRARPCHSRRAIPRVAVGRAGSPATARRAKKSAPSQ